MRQSNNINFNKNLKIMKTQFKNLLVRLTSNEMKTLAAHPQNETLATKDCNKKIFTSLDLWSIQKQKRNFISRRLA